MLAWLKARLGFKPRDAVYGFTAISARYEILDVRRRHNELLRQRAPRAEIDANIARLDAIEKRYFG